MKIIIHRTAAHTNTIVEIVTATTRILVDEGLNLGENESPSPLQLEADYPIEKIDAVFLSRYHTDYPAMTLGLRRDAALPIYASGLTSRINAAAREYKAQKPVSFAGTYADRLPILVGDIKVTPYLVDAPLQEGYLILIEGEGKKVIYAGDFHANGRKSFESMVKNLPEKVDLLLCKDGVLTEQDINPVSEREVEEQAAALIEKKKGPVFLLQSPTDFDRTASLFRAARRNKRIFLQGLYEAQLATAAGKDMPNPTDWIGIRTYLTTGYKPEHLRYRLFTALPRVSKAEIETQKFAMCVHPAMKKYLKTLSQTVRFHDGLIINALPLESRDTAETLEFLDFAQKKGLEVVTLHNSAHADAMARRALINAVNPQTVADTVTAQSELILP